MGLPLPTATPQRLTSGHHPPSVPLGVPEGWQHLLAHLGRGTTVLVLGNSGSGAGRLAHYLLGQLDRTLPRVALVDARPELPSVGVPGCLGLALTAPWRAPAALWFVGDTAPAGGLATVVGTARLAAEARRQGAAAVVLAAGDAAEEPRARERALHLALAAGVDQVTALQRGGELEPLLEVLAGPACEVHRLAAAGAPAAGRRERRRARFAAHFRDAGVRRFGRAKLLGRDWRLGSEEELSPGTLVGLIGGDGLCLALGCVEEAGRDHLAVLTPWRDPAAVHRIRAGALRLDTEVLAGGTST